MHWYNQRGEASENRIKQLKSDFGDDTLPCGEFNANDLYFNLAALACNSVSASHVWVGMNLGYEYHKGKFRADVDRAA